MNPCIQSTFLLPLLLAFNSLLGFSSFESSDRISPEAVEVLNEFDVNFVPSNWAKNVYINSGVIAPVEVLPHGIPPSFHKESKGITTPDVKRLLDLKKANKSIYILYFLTHSGHRKGADLVAEVMRLIWSKYPNVYLVVKHAEILDPYLGHLRSPKTYFVGRWMSEWELRDLYDLCDILLCPSRGGGFELNAVEAVSRGLPTLVPNDGCFLDYIDCVIPIEVERRIKLFPDNPIHIGNGWEVDINDFYRKLSEVIEHLEDYKAKFKKYAEKIRKRFHWGEIGYKLVLYLKKHGFLEE